MAQSIPEDFRIDISHEQSFRYLQTKQYDHNSRVYRLIITNNNIPITYKGNELITLHLEVNGHNYSNTTCHFHDDGYPYIDFTESMLSLEGDVSCEVRIYDSSGTTVTTTFTFMMTVSRSLLNHDRLVASSEFDILNDLILQANTIPDLLKDFKLSQSEINTFIEKVKSDITSYTNQFSTMKTKYTNDFTALITQINSDISAYQIEYNSLKSDVVNLKTSVTNWYTSAQAAESTRIQNENARIQAEALRATAENERKKAEQERIIHENSRVNNEILRSDNENKRVSEEEKRKLTESDRVSADSEREYNESIRKSNENIRLANEEKREKTYGRCEELLEKLLMIVDIDTATTLLNAGLSNTTNYTNIFDAGNADTINYEKIYNALRAW